MVLIETTVFTRRVRRLLVDDEYALLQTALMSNPEIGALISGTGGLRKVRWGTEGRGKRGGVRVIYYPLMAREQILLLLVYGKNEQGYLTGEQTQVLRRLVEQELQDG